MPLLQLEEPLGGLATEALVPWLQASDRFPRMLWQSRDGQLTVAALGLASRFKAPQEHPTHARRIWCVAGFDANQSWNGYPAHLSYIPEIELEHSPAGWTLRISLGPETSVEQLQRSLATLHRISPEPDAGLPPVVAPVRHQPQQPQWCQQVGAVQRAIADGELQKVVLARQSSLRFEAAPSLWSLYRSWSQQALNCYRFVFEPAPGDGFISLSPERLMQRSGDQLLTEALAGTAPRPSQSAEARDASLELLADSKNRHEHQLVIEDIQHKLASIGLSCSQRCETSVLQQRGIQHLHQLLQGYANPMPADTLIAHTLHPTAAVGGLPGEAASRFLCHNESLVRGWYAGYCGYLAPAAAELAVTIRSARLQGNELQLFAGAGIVALSDPLAEWQELDQKIALPLSLFVPGEEHVSRRTSLS
ncbi:isochorismate synthase [Aestuariirhabdus litorea]|uniref:isochorismate synthase n=1 Tax=Aestuariirhabdus litorea TaxID=2528527 RepID=A0A3P3VJN2_9GAMM|nr:isochorismate synthase [Aestuariirhabdus litorea]RRJ82527.1 isochorismate synthase [Aestuariirhabdus litorea]RWW92688.1 isochorismate synthase [Endozoicomonadaceae bacterium GTF-13]